MLIELFFVKCYTAEALRTSEYCLEISVFDRAGVGLFRLNVHVGLVRDVSPRNIFTRIDRPKLCSRQQSFFK